MDFRGAALWLALAAVAAIPPQAMAAGAGGPRHISLGAAAGNVSATLGYVERIRSGLPQASSFSLSIARGGAVAFGPAPPGNGSLCGPGDALCTVSRGALAVRDLEGNGEPDVTLDLWTGGAHCCTILQVYAWDPARMTYTLTQRDFGDPGYRVVDVAGNRQLELESADDRFAYAFAPFAFSGLPLQIWRFQAHRFVDVTRLFRPAVTSDAARQLRLFRHWSPQGFGLGFIAAWAADEELLGHSAQVNRTLAAQLRAGRLRTSDSRVWPGGRRFISGLRRMLRRTGYGG